MHTAWILLLAIASGVSAMVQLDLGNPQSARRMLLRLLELQPGEPNAERMLRQLAARR